MARNEPTTGDAQSIEELRGRYEKLNTRKIQVQERLDTARQRLQELQAQAQAQAQARENYGTDDVAALQSKLEEMKGENLRKRTEYQQSLDAIEADLAKVETEQAAGSAQMPATNGDEGEPWQ